MDLLVLIGIASALLIIILSIFFLKKNNDPPKAPAPQQRGVPVRAQEGIPRRAQIARNQRNRIRGTAATSSASATADFDESDDDNDENTLDRPKPDFGDEKIGTKKRAKLEAKAEKKAQREVDLKHREDKKKQEALADEERKKIEQKEKEEELKREETERLEREEKERQEYEEYLKMKEAFSVEEEGFEEGDDGDKENQLQEFVNFIKKNKVIVLEDLAAEFKLKTQATIDRISDLQKDGIITGVTDDRGKFIYISEDELKSVAKFIKQRGRVSITELAESSNKLINLTPITVE